MNLLVTPCRRTALRGLLGLAAFAVLLGFGRSPTARADAIGDALDAPGLAWTNTAPSGGGPWTVDTVTTHDGSDAARSGTPPYGVQALLETAVTGPGTVVFWAKASTPGGSYLWAQAHILHIIRNADWHAYTMDVPAGVTKLVFSFVNQDAAGTNNDAVWVDQVSFADYSGQPPVLVGVPPNATVGDGDYLTWWADATGEKPFSGVWQHAGTNRIAFANVYDSHWGMGIQARPTEAGDWRLIVTNALGVTPPSSVFTLTVTSTPPHALYVYDSFGTGLDPLPLTPAAAFSLTVDGAGTLPFTYQWRKGAGDLLGETNASLAFTNFTPAQAGVYTCVVSNALGGAESSSRALSHSLALPTITSQPSPVSLSSGDWLHLSVAAAGALPFQYQWFKDGQALLWDTGPDFYRWSVSPEDTGSYRVRVTNANGVAWSEPVIVRVDGTLLLGEALNQPSLLWTSSDGDPSLPGPGWRVATNTTHDGVAAAQTVLLPDYETRTVTLATEFNGPARISFWWKLQATSYDHLRFEAVNSIGNTNVFADVSGSFGWVQQLLDLPPGTFALRWVFASDPVSGGGFHAGTAWVDQVQINPFTGIVIYEQPQDQWLPLGVGTGNFVCLATNFPPTALNYQWEYEGADIFGANSPTYSDTSPGHYRCRVFNNTMTNYSRTALLGYAALFPDPSLAMAVRTNLGLAAGAPIPLSSVETMTELNANYDYYGSLNRITNLTGLASASSLQTLRLQSQGITDVSELAGLTSLTWLDLDYNQVKDISPLLSLHQLRGLRLHSNGVTNAPLVTGLPNLVALVLTRNGLTNINFLAGLPQLTNLWCGLNLYTNAAPLAGLTNLTELRLTELPFMDFSFVGSFSNLTILAIGGNPLTNASFVDNLTKLQTLYLNESHLTHAPVLTNKSALTLLWLDHNELTEAPDLHGLTNLTQLWLQVNRLSDPSPLTNAPRLNWLLLGNNSLTNIAPLLALTNLSAVEVQWNFLNTNAASADMAVVTTLQSRGVTVSYLPQNVIVLFAPQINGGGQFSFDINTPPGTVVQVLVSSNLLDWSLVTTVTNVTGTTNFTAPLMPSGNYYYWLRKL